MNTLKCANCSKKPRGYYLLETMNLNYIRLSAFWLACFFLYLYSNAWEEQTRAFSVFGLCVAVPLVFICNAKPREEQ